MNTFIFKYERAAFYIKHAWGLFYIYACVSDPIISRKNEPPPLISNECINSFETHLCSNYGNNRHFQSLHDFWLAFCLIFTLSRIFMNFAAGIEQTPELVFYFSRSLNFYEQRMRFSSYLL